MANTKGSDNPFPSILMVEGDPEDLADNPSSGQRRLAVGTDHLLYLVDDAGVATEVGSGSGGDVATDAIWNAAGDLAVGTGSDTAARLAIGNAGAVLARINGAVASATGDRFFRTDLGMEFYYDGTRWVSMQLHHILTEFHNVGATTAYSAPSDSTGGSGYLKFGVPALSGGSDLWLVGLTTQFLVAGGTALSGSHKWVGVFSKRPTGNTNTTLITVTIDSGSSSVWRTDTQAIGALLNNGTTHYVFDFSMTKTGTPGPIFALTDLTYRIVAT
jgi:hypothetical protein